jgi:hypothetical protein
MNPEKLRSSGRANSPIGKAAGAAWRTSGSAQRGATTTGKPGRLSCSSSGASFW